MLLAWEENRQNLIKFTRQQGNKPASFLHVLFIGHFKYLEFLSFQHRERPRIMRNYHINQLSNFWPLFLQSQQLRLVLGVQLSAVVPSQQCAHTVLPLRLLKLVPNMIYLDEIYFLLPKQ